MSSTYNHLAGRSLERIGALSDGVFAIAMTLIVLEIRLPELEGAADNASLWSAFVTLGPAFITYVLSFLTLGIFWNGQQTQLSYLAGADRHLAWLYLVFLALVALMPFSTSVLSEHTGLSLAVIIYWANIALLGIAIYACWAYATHAGLLTADTPAAADAAIRRRIIAAQLLYLGGAALSLLSPTVAIGFIVLVQLNFAIAPRIPILSRI